VTRRAHLSKGRCQLIEDARLLGCVLLDRAVNAAESVGRYTLSVVAGAISQGRTRRGERHVHSALRPWKPWPGGLRERDDHSASRPLLLTTLGISYVAVTKGDKQIAGNQMSVGAGSASRNRESARRSYACRMRRMGPPTSAKLRRPSPRLGVYVVNDPGNRAWILNTTHVDRRAEQRRRRLHRRVERALSRDRIEAGLAPLSSKLDYRGSRFATKLNGANQFSSSRSRFEPGHPPREESDAGRAELMVTARAAAASAPKTVTVEAIRALRRARLGPTRKGRLIQRNSFYIDGHDHNPRALGQRSRGSALPGSRPPTTRRPSRTPFRTQQETTCRAREPTRACRSSSVNLDLPAIAAQWPRLANISKRN